MVHSFIRGFPASRNSQGRGQFTSSQRSLGKTWDNMEDVRLNLSQALGGLDWSLALQGNPSLKGILFKIFVDFVD